jgi:hypothetical protein
MIDVSRFPVETQWVHALLLASDSANLIRQRIWSLRACLIDGWLMRTDTRMTIYASGAVKSDGRRWLHLSMSYADRLPSYSEMTATMRAIMGNDAVAIHFLALESQSEWINVHEFCLHWWHCVDGSPLPDFSRGVGAYERALDCMSAGKG